MRCVGDALFEQKTRLVKPWDKETVDDKSWPVCANDHDLTQHFAVLNHLLNRGLARGLGRYYLNKAVLGGVVKEVQTNESVGSAGGLCERIDRKRGGVGCKNGVVTTGLVERVEHCRFDVEVLKHRLDHQIGVVRSVLNANDPGNPSLNTVDLGRRKNAAFNGFIEKRGDDRLPAFNPLQLSVDHLDVEFFLSAFLRYS